MAAHLADWYLTRETFEQVPDRPGFYRLTAPERNGLRRVRQAVQDLRSLGFSVRADYSLEPGTSGPHRQATFTRNGPDARRSRIAYAARRPSNATASLSPTTRNVLSAPAQPAPSPAPGNARKR
ncbi:hypothetical protein [Streptomyces albus]|uniref:hypothetical protein n=1 Tax=Streptomyces albus TaxID=1888 RepID=UPI003F196285